MQATSSNKIFYSDGYIQAKNYYKENGLEVPYIPEGLMNQISEIQPEVFGSKESDHSLYDINHFLGEVLSKKVDNYVLFGAGGYGTNTHAMHYYAVNKHLALFMQLADVDVYGDEKALKARNASLSYIVEPFFTAIGAAAQKGLIPAGERLLVVYSDFYGKGWCWIKEGQGKIDPATWHADENILMALAAIPSEAKKA